jgi:hypothetical protein
VKQWFTRVKNQMLADKKKSGAMIALLAVGLLLWGRLLLKDVPKTATAVPKATATHDTHDTLDLVGDRVPRVEVDWPTKLPRDLFALDASRYRRTATDDTRAVEDKSPQALTDKDIKIEALRRRARDLTLQSVITGSEPRAMINGRFMQIGQSVNGFELLEIHERSVILRMQDVKLRLSM